MLLLHYLENVERPDGTTPTEEEGRAFRLFVKERLYRFNYVRHVSHWKFFRIGSSYRLTT